MEADTARAAPRRAVAGGLAVPRGMSLLATINFLRNLVVEITATESRLVRLNQRAETSQIRCGFNIFLEISKIDLLTVSHQS